MKNKNDEQNNNENEDLMPDYTPDSKQGMGLSWLTYLIVAAIVVAVAFFVYLKLTSTTTTNSAATLPQLPPVTSPDHIPLHDENKTPVVEQQQTQPQMPPQAQPVLPVQPEQPQAQPVLPVQPEQPQAQPVLPVQPEQPQAQPVLPMQPESSANNTTESMQPSPDQLPKSPSNGVLKKPMQPAQPESESIIVENADSDASSMNMMQNLKFDNEMLQNSIRTYILAHPEVILESIKQYEKKANKALKAPTNDNVKKVNNMSDNGPFLGNRNGNIVIIKFFDYNCGYCKKSHAILEKIMSNNADVKVVLEAIPLLGERSLKAARLSTAAWLLNQSQFKNIHAELFSVRNLDDKTMSTLAAKYDLNKESWMEKMNSLEVTQIIESNTDKARKIELQGVPSYIINGMIARGSLSYEEVQEKITPKLTKTLVRDSQTNVPTTLVQTR